MGEVRVMAETIPDFKTQKCRNNACLQHQFPINSKSRNRVTTSFPYPK
jgi:hypothetical protein